MSGKLNNTVWICHRWVTNTTFDCGLCFVLTRKLREINAILFTDPSSYPVSLTSNLIFHPYSSRAFPEWLGGNIVPKASWGQSVSVKMHPPCTHAWMGSENELPGQKYIKYSRRFTEFPKYFMRSSCRNVVYFHNNIFLRRPHGQCQAPALKYVTVYVNVSSPWFNSKSSWMFASRGRSIMYATYTILHFILVPKESP